MTTEVIIEGGQRLSLLPWADALRYRGLLVFLTWRNIKIRYSQTVLGALWAILQPTLAMVVFAGFFGKFAKLSPEGVPYPIWSYAGLLPWLYLSEGWSRAANSLVASQNLVKKVFFPRIFLPLSETAAGLLDLFVASSVLIVLMAIYRVPPSAGMLFALLSVVVAFFLASGVGFFLAAINVKYRDIRYTIPFLTQLWMFLSPVVYSPEMVPESVSLAGFEIPARAVFLWNPVVGVLEGFRWALLGIGEAPWGIMGRAAAVTAAIFLLGYIYFQRKEREFADVV